MQYTQTKQKQKLAYLLIEPRISYCHETEFEQQWINKCIVILKP